MAARRYRFRLLANPTVTREGKRYGLTREHEQLAWIARQGKRHGFPSWAACAVQTNDCRSGRGAANRTTLHTALFDGVLRVDSPESLRQSMLNGFGHGKAMGAGMLSLARLDS